MNYDALLNIVHREVTRVMAATPRRIGCVVDGYNPQQHTVRITTRPDGVLSGWVQIAADQIGSLVAPSVGDPGWLEFHEGDGDAPVFVGSSHNDLVPPPAQIEAGERLYKHKSGSSHYFKNDGSVALTDKNGSVIELDGTGNVTITAATAVTVHAPLINLGNGGALQPVKLANGAPSTVVMAQ